MNKRVKHFIATFALMMSLVSSAQLPPGYMPDGKRNSMRALNIWEALHVPAGSTPSLPAKNWNGAGALYVDSINHNFYFFSGSSWRRPLNLSDTSILLATQHDLLPFFKNGGNTFGGIAVFGVTDSNAVTFITKNLERGRVSAKGNWLFGTTNDNEQGLLQVAGGIAPSTDNAMGLGTATHRWLQIYTDIVRSGTSFRIFINGSQQFTIRNMGQVSIGTMSASDSSAKLAINSTVRGFLMPRMTTAQKNAIAGPAVSLMVFDTDLGEFHYWNGSVWTPIGISGSGSGTDNANAGSGLFWLHEGTQVIKSAFVGYGTNIDSTSNPNGLTFGLDSTVVFPHLRATIPAPATPTLAQTIAAGNQFTGTTTIDADTNIVNLNKVLGFQVTNTQGGYGNIQNSSFDWTVKNAASGATITQQIQANLTRLRMRHNLSEILISDDITLNATGATKIQNLPLVTDTTGYDIVFRKRSGDTLVRIPSDLVGGSAALSIGTIDSESKSANGAVIDGSSLVLQTVDEDYPGLATPAMIDSLDNEFFLTNIGDGEDQLIPIAYNNIGVKSIKEGTNISITQPDDSVNVIGITGVIPSTNGGTGNGFTKFTGPSSAERTFTLPDADGTIAIATGKSGGQGIIGGTGANEMLILKGTSATVGNTGTNPNTAIIVGNGAGITAFSVDNNGKSTFGGAVDFGANTVENYLGKFNDQTGTTYTLLASDNGKIITLNNGSAITLTVPSGLPVGFNCTILQKGAGKVTFTASGTTINNRSSHTKTAGQMAIATIISYANDIFVTGGDMEP